MLKIRFAFLLLAPLHLTAFAADDKTNDLYETIVQVPISNTQQNNFLVATTYHPRGDGPFPLIVLSHGTSTSAEERQKIGRYRKIKQIREFVKRGFAVIVPIRQGYGETSGLMVDQYSKCSNSEFYRVGLKAAEDIISSVNFAKRLSFVNPNKIILIGQSAGAFASLAAASLNPNGVIGVVNFAGGRGGDPDKHPGVPCGANQMAETFAQFGQATQIPSLWIYSSNDKYFAPSYVEKWHSSYTQYGANAKLVIKPAFKDNGHNLFKSDEGIAIWLPDFDLFLNQIRSLKN